MLSCFVRNVPFLWQNTPSNTHAGQAKLEVFKCGESCLLYGKRDNMNMYKARPSSYYMENVTTLSVCLRSAARSYSLCREEYYQEQVGVKPCRQRAGLGWASAGPAAPHTWWSLPSQSPQHLNFTELLSTWHYSSLPIHPVYALRGKLLGPRLSCQNSPWGACHVDLWHMMADVSMCYGCTPVPFGL